MRFVYILISIFFFLISCSDKDAERLRGKMSSEIVNNNFEGQKLDGVSILRYREIEKRFNADYIHRLENIVNTSFEKSLDEFEDEELGFFSNYIYMFSYFFTSKESWEDKFRIKSNKYFNTLELQRSLTEEYEEYLKNIVVLREQLIHQEIKKGNNLPKIASVELKNNEIYLGELRNHSLNNFVVEFGTKFFIWMFITLIVFIISLFGFGIGVRAWIITALSFFASIGLSMYNDRNLLKSLRDQNTKSIEQNYQGFLNTINLNTDAFYDEISK